MQIKLKQCLTSYIRMVEPQINFDNDEIIISLASF